jgi:hypothetical protein
MKKKIDPTAKPSHFEVVMGTIEGAVAVFVLIFAAVLIAQGLYLLQVSKAGGQ